MKHVALLRGINVGGKNKLPMKDLLAICDGIGWKNAKHVIQSGNLVFEASNPDPLILSNEILAKFGFAPTVMIFTKSEFEAIATACPFTEKLVAGDGKALHTYYAHNIQAPNSSALDELKTPTEEWAIAAGCFHLWAPDGMARSKLAEKAPRLLNAETTARNWNTVAKILEILKP